MTIWSGYCDVAGCGWHGPHTHLADGIVTGTVMTNIGTSLRSERDDLHARIAELEMKLKASHHAGTAQTYHIAELESEVAILTALLRRWRNQCRQGAGLLVTTLTMDTDAALETPG